jgi:hypothetical protein
VENITETNGTYGVSINASSTLKAVAKMRMMSADSLFTMRCGCLSYSTGTCHVNMRVEHALTSLLDERQREKDILHMQHTQ